MKKISILLMSVLFILAVSCSSPSNPDNNNNNNNNNIALSERAGTYNGQITKPFPMDLVMILDSTGTLTSLMVNGNESVDPNNPIKLSNDPNSKETVFGPFEATINLNGQESKSRVRVTFNSGTDKTQGAKAEIDLMTTGNFNPTINADLKYQAN